MKIMSGLKKIFHANPHVFGCDISDHSIRIARLKPSGNGLTLATFNAEPLKDGVISGGVINDAAAAAQAVRDAVAHSRGQRLATPYVVASLPESQCFLRIVQLPKLKQEEIGKALTWEIEANIPLAISDVYYDWLEPVARDKDQEHIDVLVAAAPKRLVESYTEMFAAAHLKPVAFEIDSLAAARSVIPRNASHEEGATMIIDISFHRTTYTIYAMGYVRFTSSVAVGGKNFSADGGAGMAKDLATHARQYAEYFNDHPSHAHSTDAQVHRIYICGDTLHATGLSTELSRVVQVPVHIANPWVNILTPPLHDVPLLSYKESLSYAVALGLALRAREEFEMNS